MDLVTINIINRRPTVTVNITNRRPLVTVNVLKKELVPITKQAIEDVLTGEITSHSHSITKQAIETALTGEITSHTHPVPETEHIVVLNQNVYFNTIAYSDITGLEIPVVPGTYYFRFFLSHVMESTAIAACFSIYTLACSRVEFKLDTSASSSTQRLLYHQTSDAGSPINTSNGSGCNIAVLEGIAVCITPGTIKGRASRETNLANNSYVKSGSYVAYRKIA